MSARLQPGHGLLRWARVAAFSVPAVGFAVLLHAAAQGCVSTRGVLEASVSCLAAGGICLRQEQGQLRLAGWLLSCQALTHGLLQAHCSPGQVGGVLAGDRLLTAHLAAAALAAAFLSPAEKAMWAASRIGPAVRRAAARCLARPRPILIPVAAAGRLLAPLAVRLPVATPACPPPLRRGPPVVAPRL